MAAYDPEAPLSEEKLVSEEPPEIRAGFIAKVYGILTAQLLLTAAIAVPFVMSESAKAWIATKGFPLVIMAAVLNLVFLLAIMRPCSCERSKRAFPTNCTLFGFTVTEGPLLGVWRASYASASVLLAVLCTAAQVGGLAAYALFTKADFTGMGVYSCAACTVLMIIGMFCLFFHRPLMHNVYCCLGTIVFSFHLIYEIQLIVGSGQCSLTVDDCVLGALQLYIDIFQVFLCILSLIGDRK